MGKVGGEWSAKQDEEKGYYGCAEGGGEEEREGDRLMYRWN